MAQIKKFTQGGPAIIQDPEKSYGKIFRNGTPYDVHEDTLKWLEGHGSVGIEMARELREGIDQHIDIGSDGVGIIRNISSGTSGMNYRQRRRISRKQGIFGGLFEDPSTKMTREIVQGLAEQNYSNFKDNREIYSFPDITMELETSLDEQKNPIYTIIPTSTANLDAIKRLDEIIKNKGVVIPDGKKADNYDEINKLNQYIFDHIDQIKTIREALKTNNGKKLSSNDIQLLRGLGIVYSPSEKVGDSTVADIQAQAEQEDKLAEAKTSFANMLGIQADDSLIDEFEFIYDSAGKNFMVKAKESLINKFGKNYMFSKYDSAKYKPLDGYALFDGELSTIDNLERNWTNYKDFIRHLNQIDYASAKKLMNFATPAHISLDKNKWKYYKKGSLNITNLPLNVWYFEPDASSVYYAVFDKNWHPLLHKFNLLKNKENISAENIEENSAPEEKGDNTTKVNIIRWNGLTGFKLVKTGLRTRRGVDAEVIFFYDRNKKILYHLPGGKKRSLIEFETDVDDGIRYEEIQKAINGITYGDPSRKEFHNQLQNSLLDYFNKTPSKKYGGSLSIPKLQDGDVVRPANEEVPEEDIDTSKTIDPDTLSSYLNEYKNWTSHDWAEAAGTIADIIAFGISKIAGKTSNPKKLKNAILYSKLIDLAGTAAYTYAAFRDDKFDTSDAKQLFIDAVGSIPNRKNVSTLMNIFGKAAQVYGITNGAATLQKINTMLDGEASIGDLTWSEISALWYGLKGVLTMAGAIKDAAFTSRFTKMLDTEDSNTSKHNKSFEQSLSKKDFAKISKTLVDETMSRTDIDLTEAKKQKWFDVNNDRVLPNNYTQAYRWLKQQKIIGDEDLAAYSDEITGGVKAEKTVKNAKQIWQFIKDLGIGLQPEDRVYIENLSKDDLKTLMKWYNQTAQNHISAYNKNFRKAFEEHIKKGHTRINGGWVEHPSQQSQSVKQESSSPSPKQSQQPQQVQSNSNPEPKKSGTMEELLRGDSTPTENPSQPKQSSQEPQEAVTVHVDEIEITPSDPPHIAMKQLFDQIKRGQHTTNWAGKLKTIPYFPDKLGIEAIEYAKSKQGTLDGKPFIKHVTFKRNAGTKEYIFVYDPDSMSRLWAVYDMDGKLLEGVKKYDASISEKKYRPESDRPIPKPGTFTVQQWKDAVNPGEGHITYKRTGGKILKAYFGNRIERLFDSLRSANENWSDKDVYQHISDHADLFKVRKKKADLLNTALSTANAWDENGKKNSNFFGLTDPEQKNIFGMIAPVVEYGVSARGNQKVKNKETKAIRKRSLGEMQSMPIKKPHVSTNLNPLYKQYNDQKTELWGHTMNINNTLSDTRAKLANMNNTMSKLNVGEQDLLGQVSKQLTSDSTQNANLDWTYDAETRRIADASNKVSANTAASIIEKESEYIGTKFDNAEKFIAELRDNENKFNAARRNKELYTEIQLLQSEYRDMTDDEKKGDRGIAVLNKIRALTKLMDSAAAYSRFTGKYSI